MIGFRVEQRVVADGTPDPGIAPEHLPPAPPYTIKLAGTVVALERGGQPATWSALVMKGDGSLVVVAADYLTVVDPKPEEFDPRPSVESAGESRAIEACSEEQSALDRLDKFLEDNFKETDHGGGPIEWAESLLAEFKKELLEIAAERDKLTAELKKARKKGDKPAEEKQP